MHACAVSQVGRQAELRAGDRIESLCGSRNRLTGLGLSGVCAAGRRAQTVYILHNVHKKVRTKCMHARMHFDAGMKVDRKAYKCGQTDGQAGLSFVCKAVKQALVWPGFEVPAGLRF